MKQVSSVYGRMDWKLWNVLMSRQAGEVPLLVYVTPIFIELKLAHTIRFFYRRQIVGWKGSEQKLAYTIRF